jgi:hypothetical protein
MEDTTKKKEIKQMKNLGYNVNTADDRVFVVVVVSVWSIVLWSMFSMMESYNILHICRKWLIIYEPDLVIDVKVFTVICRAFCS